MTRTYPLASGFGRVTTPLVDRNRPLFETCGHLDPFLKTLDLISPGLLNGLISEGLVDGFESFEIPLGVRPDFMVRLRLELGIGGGGIVADFIDQFWPLMCGILHLNDASVIVAEVSDNSSLDKTTDLFCYICL